jgi:hypothetical protein
MRDLTRGQPAVLRRDRRRPRDGVCKPKSQERLDSRKRSEDLRDGLSRKVGHAAGVELIEMRCQVG